MFRTETSPLLTDLYQLTMLQGYYERGMTDVAVFEFFVRRLPPNRNFLIAAGLDRLLDYLEQLRFSDEEIYWIRRSGKFSSRFAERLVDLRFEGEVHALPEGTVFFADEPVVRITAPLPQAQLIETRLINLLHLQTLIASKAIRSVLAAPDKLLVDFGMRRAHGAEAALLAARAAYIAGFTGTSNVAAAMRFGIEPFGTMAHSYIEAHDTEEQAFYNFARAHPQNTTLLIDTYDTEAAAHKVVHIAARLRAEGIAIKAVRIDSGDLAAQAHRVRAILDAGGCKDVGIFASGNLDEYLLHWLAANNAPIDGYGIGTHLDTSADAPFLDCAYKLQEYAGRPRRKRSLGKATWPGRKQVYRLLDHDGLAAGDLLTLETDTRNAAALIQPVMRAGRRLVPPEPLESMRARVARELAHLPAYLRELDEAPTYPVNVSPALQDLADAVDQTTASETSEA